MNKKKKQAREQENLNIFNSIIQKIIPENQYQAHNVIKEALSLLTKRDEHSS